MSVTAEPPAVSVWFGMSHTGGSFSISVTVTATDCDTSFSPSSAVTVTVALPCATGVIVSVEPDTLARATPVALDEAE